MSVERESGRLMSETKHEQVIQVERLHKVFNPESENRVVALSDINLLVERGEFISLIGPSGCGKSTLLRLMADLLTLQEGELRINGKLPAQARLDRDYGFVFQAATLYDWRTISKNVQLPLEIMKFPKPEREARARELLELVELKGFEKHYPWQLSGGMQQSVAIARALVFEPTLLLMDEPFGALDEFTRERMNMELMRIWEQKELTVMFVTHSIPEAVFLSSRIVVMSARPGRIIKIVKNEVEYPRVFTSRKTQQYYETVNEVREALASAHSYEI